MRVWMLMSETPKSRQFQTWGAPPTPTNGDKPHPVPASSAVQDRKANVKRAAFFVAVALLFVLANHLGSRKNASDENPNNLSSLALSVWISPKHQLGDEARSLMSTRLRNKGRHPVFYAVSAGMDVPFGQIVRRTSTSSK